MFVYLSKKIAIPNNTIVRSLGWNKEQGYIACGCDGGLLKVLKLESRRDDTGGAKNLGPTTNLSTNQTLEGHSGSVGIVKWNEVYQKLTSSDQNGLIMVWMLHQGIWYEEMINNRNKSVVTGMAWNMDGQKICIVYEDGAIIVGSVDGNRIWGKELKGTHLSKVEWSPDGKIILFGLQNGEVHIYEGTGSFLAKLPLPCLETAVSAQLVSIRWCKKSRRDLDSPSLVIAYENGVIQLMKNENDKKAIVLNTELNLSSLDWNTDGSILAVTGKLYGTETEKKNIVKFYDPYGQQLQMIRVPGREITACSWEGNGLRIALSVDSFIFFANIRPDYKWCFFADTLAYVFNRSDRIENAVMFWNINTNEKHVKLVKNLLAITSAANFCVFVTKADDGSGQYSVILCNAIGSPVDSRYIDVEPLFLAMNSSYIYVASSEAIYSWHFHSPRSRAILELTSEKSRSGQEKTIYVDDAGRGASSVRDRYHQKESVRDKICCITASDKVLMVARFSGVIQRYLIPQLALTHRYTFDCHPIKISLNCASTRMSIIDTTGVLYLYDLDSEAIDSAGQETIGKKLKFERKDVWDIKWASDNPEMFAVMEKTRMYVFRDLDPEEPVPCSGYMCDFTDLEVKAVQLDEVMQNPDDPKEDFIIQNEVKSLRDTRNLLEKVGIKEATKFIEDNPHPRLWQLLAEAGIRQMDFETAELAFVKRKDYSGLQFVKKVAELKSSFIRKAEVCSYFKEFDEAEKLYVDNDRTDLAIGLRRQLGDWFRVAQLLKTGAADDKQIEEAWNAIGDYYADRQKYENAITYYIQGHNEDRIAKCYYMLEDYSGLEGLVNSLPENHKLLPEIGSMFASIGMCEQAVLAYLKCNKIKTAIESCVALSQWNMAITLAQKHNIKDIDTLLAEYAKHLMEENNVLNAVELYRKAHKFLDAARVLLSFIKEESKKKKELLYMKKMYLLVGMLVEEHRSKAKSRSAGALSRSYPWKDNPLMPSDDSLLVYDPWRGAEACHFMLLAHKQLYEGHIDNAMKTTLNLRDYEDILNVEEIYCLLALTSCTNRAFATCSSAFMKLESLEELSEAHRTEYEDLAYEIFLKHPPKDARIIRVDCSSCNEMVPDYSTTCPNCNTKFPVCVATGKPMIVTSPQWTCNRCHHVAFKQEMLNKKCCPLCHCTT